MPFTLLLYELYRQTAETFVNVSCWLFVGLSDSGFVSVYSPIITNNFGSLLYFKFLISNLQQISAAQLKDVNRPI